MKGNMCSLVEDRSADVAALCYKYTNTLFRTVFILFSISSPPTPDLLLGDISISNESCS